MHHKNPDNFFPLQVSLPGSALHHEGLFNQCCQHFCQLSVGKKLAIGMVGFIRLLTLIQKGRTVRIFHGCQGSLVQVGSLW